MATYATYENCTLEARVKGQGGVRWSVGLKYQALLMITNEESDVELPVAVITTYDQAIHCGHALAIKITPVKEYIQNNSVLAS